MNKFRICAMVLFVFALCFLLVGCEQTRFQEYENFSDDMDLKARAEEYLKKAKNGDESAFFEDEVLTYIDDINSFNDTDNPKAREISEYYILCAQNILATIEHNRNKDEFEASISYKAAEANYAEAVMIYEDFTIKRNDIK